MLEYLATLKKPWTLTGGAVAALPASAWSAAELNERASSFWFPFWCGIGTALLCVIVLWNIGDQAERRLEKRGTAA